MRARLDPTFSDYLLRIGNGEEESNYAVEIQFPNNMTIPYIDEVASLKELLDVVFPEIDVYLQKLETMINRVILTPKMTVDQINNLMMARFPGYAVKCYSFDEPIDKADETFQQEFLNTLVLNGIPPHELVLKKNCLSCYCATVTQRKDYAMEQE